MKRVEKPWGHELIWALTDRYCGKVLFVKAGDETLALAGTWWDRPCLTPTAEEERT